MVLSARLILMVLALVFAIGGLLIGGIVLVSVNRVDALVIGLHEVSLAVAVILLTAAALIPETGHS